MLGSLTSQLWAQQAGAAWYALNAHVLSHRAWQRVEGRALGAVVKDAAFQVEFDNLSATPEMVYIKEKDSVAAGEYPYEVYLNWIYHGYQGTGGGGEDGGGY